MEERMAGQKWCIKATPLYEKPGGKQQKITLAVNSIYELTGNLQISAGKTWTEVKFIDRDQIARQGWVQDVYLEDYEDDPNSRGFEVLIPHPTADSTDAAQYMKWEKDAKYTNMCGELCVAFIAGEDIETFLTKWKGMAGSFYSRIIPFDIPTGPDVVNNMLKVYGYPDKYVNFQQGLTDADTGLRKTPGRFQKMLATHYLIAAVRIDAIAGNIGEGKIGHWVVVDKVISDGINRGWVEIYNPFPNKRQTYSFDEFIRSCEAEGMTGIWVNRTLPPSGD
jgi:hypothetical protein